MVLPSKSLNVMCFSLKEFDLIVPVTTAVVEEDQDNGEEQGFMLMITVLTDEAIGNVSLLMIALSP